MDHAGDDSRWEMLRAAAAALADEVNDAYHDVYNDDDDDEQDEPNEPDEPDEPDEKKVVGVDRMTSSATTSTIQTGAGSTTPYCCAKLTIAEVLDPNNLVCWSNGVPLPDWVQSLFKDAAKKGEFPQIKFINPLADALEPPAKKPRHNIDSPRTSISSTSSTSTGGLKSTFASNDGHGGSVASIKRGRGRPRRMTGVQRVDSAETAIWKEAAVWMPGQVNLDAWPELLNMPISKEQFNQFLSLINKRPTGAVSNGDVLDGKENLKKRKRMSLGQSDQLMAWLIDHLKHPYLSDAEHAELAARLSLSLSKIQVWLVNARQRIVKTFWHHIYKKHHETQPVPPKK